MRVLIGFIFPRRIQRLDYLCRILITNAGVDAAFAVGSPSEFGYTALGALAIFIYQIFFVVLARLRDAGMSGWLVLLGLIPFVYIFLTILLLFRPPEFHFTDVADESAAKA